MVALLCDNVAHKATDQTGTSSKENASLDADRAGAEFSACFPGERQVVAAECSVTRVALRVHFFRRFDSVKIPPTPREPAVSGYHWRPDLSGDCHPSPIGRVRTVAQAQLQKAAVMSSSLEREYEKALEAIMEDNGAAAELCCRRLMKLDPEDPRTIEVQAEVAALKGNPTAARSLFEKLLKQSDQEYVLVGLGRLGDIHGSQRQFDKAIQYHRKTVTLASKLGNDLQLLNSLHQIAIIDVELGHLNQAVEEYERIRRHIAAMSEDDAEDYFDDYLTACQEQADALRMIGRLDEADAILCEVIEKSDLIDDPISTATAYCSRGVICQIRGQYDEAERHHLKSVEIAEEEEWTEGLSMNYGNLAMLNIHRKNYDEAENWATKAYRISREERDPTDKIHYYLVMAEIEFERDHLEKAEVYAQKALKLSERQGDREDVAVAQSKLGVIYRKLGQFTQSEEWSMNSLEALREMNHGDGSPLRFWNSQSFEGRGRIAEAKKLAKKPRTISAVERTEDDSGSPDVPRRTLTTIVSFQLLPKPGSPFSVAHDDASGRPEFLHLLWVNTVSVFDAVAVSLLRVQGFHRLVTPTVPPFHRRDSCCGQMGRWPPCRNRVCEQVRQAHRTLPAGRSDPRAGVPELVADIVRE